MYPVCHVDRKEGYRRRNNFGAVNNWRKRVEKQVNNAQKEVNNVANNVANQVTVPSVSLPVIGDVTGKKRKRDADEDEG